MEDRLEILLEWGAVCFLRRDCVVQLTSPPQTIAFVRIMTDIIKKEEKEKNEQNIKDEIILKEKLRLDEELKMKLLTQKELENEKEKERKVAIKENLLSEKARIFASSPPHLDINLSPDRRSRLSIIPALSRALSPLNMIRIDSQNMKPMKLMNNQSKDDLILYGKNMNATNFKTLHAMNNNNNNDNDMTMNSYYYNNIHNDINDERNNNNNDNNNNNNNNNNSINSNGEKKDEILINKKIASQKNSSWIFPNTPQSETYHAKEVEKGGSGKGTFSPVQSMFSRGWMHWPSSITTSNTTSESNLNNLPLDSGVSADASNKLNSSNFDIAVQESIEDRSVGNEIENENMNENENENENGNEENEMKFNESLEVLHGWFVSTPYGYGIVRNISIKISGKENQKNVNICNSSSIDVCMPDSRSSPGSCILDKMDLSLHSSLSCVNELYTSAGSTMPDLSPLPPSLPPSLPLSLPPSLPPSLPLSLPPSLPLSQDVNICPNDGVKSNINTKENSILYNDIMSNENRLEKREIKVVQNEREIKIVQNDRESSYEALLKSSLLFPDLKGGTSEAISPADDVGTIQDKGCLIYEKRKACTPFDGSTVSTSASASEQLRGAEMGALGHNTVIKAETETKTETETGRKRSEDVGMTATPSEGLISMPVDVPLSAVKALESHSATAAMTSLTYSLPSKVDPAAHTQSPHTHDKELPSKSSESTISTTPTTSIATSIASSAAASGICTLENRIVEIIVQVDLLTDPGSTMSGEGIRYNSTDKGEYNIWGKAYLLPENLTILPTSTSTSFLNQKNELKSLKDVVSSSFEFDSDSGSMIPESNILSTNTSLLPKHPLLSSVSTDSSSSLSVAKLSTFPLSSSAPLTVFLPLFTNPMNNTTHFKIAELEHLSVLESNKMKKNEILNASEGETCKKEKVISEIENLNITISTTEENNLKSEHSSEECMQNILPSMVPVPLNSFLPYQNIIKTCHEKYENSLNFQNFENMKNKNNTNNDISSNNKNNKNKNNNNNNNNNNSIDYNDIKRNNHQNDKNDIDINIKNLNLKSETKILRPHKGILSAGIGSSYIASYFPSSIFDMLSFRSSPVSVTYTVPLSSNDENEKNERNERNEKNHSNNKSSNEIDNISKNETGELNVAKEQEILKKSEMKIKSEVVKSSEFHSPAENENQDNEFNQNKKEEKKILMENIHDINVNMIIIENDNEMNNNKIINTLSDTIPPISETFNCLSDYEKTSIFDNV